MPRTFSSFAALAALSALAACSSSKPAVKSTSDDATLTSEGGISPERKGNEKVTAYDLNHDKRPDVWEYTVPGKSADGRDIDKLVRKELDINWDGKVDITRY